MRLLIRILVVLGCAAILFGFLAFDFIPYRIILPAMSPEQRAQIDRSIFELDWVNRGFYSIAAGGLLLATALLVHLFSKRAKLR